MGHSGSKSSNDPIKLEGQSTSPYDRFSDVDESGDVKIETAVRTSTRPMWRYTLAIFLAFLAFVIATGVSCALEEACKASDNGIPGISRMLNTTRTSLYLMTTMNALIGVHLTEVYSISQLVSERASILGKLQGFTAMLIYASIFANLGLNMFEVMVVTAALILAWMALVTEALRRFYVRGVSRLWGITVPLVVVYAISATLYTTFTLVTFPYKEVGVVVVEVLMVVSCAGFAFMLIPHTRWVILETVVKK